MNTSDSTPNGNHIRDNTIEYLLTNDNVELRWENTPGAYGSAQTVDGQGIVRLNDTMVDAGPGPARLNVEDESHVLLNTLAHEVNHLVSAGESEGGYSDLMHQYRAWYVGFTAENGHPPTRKEALDYVAIFLEEDRSNFLEDYRDNPQEQALIVAFVAELGGIDNPSSATKADVDALIESRSSVEDGDAPASLPRPSGDGEPNNLDNAS